MMLSILYTIFDSRLSDGEFQSLLSILPQKDQDRILRFRRWQDRQIHLAGRLLLLKGLVEGGFTPGILGSVKTNSYGKPFITDNIEFSLSNSGMCAVCAITDNVQIGIDVETLNDIEISDFRSLMSLDEWNDIQNDRNRLTAFYNFWTKKEAALKADGRGFSVPLEQIHIEKNSAILSDKKWLITEIPLEAPYICHLAAENPVNTIFIQKVSPENFCNIFCLADNPSSIYVEDPTLADPVPLSL